MERSMAKISRNAPCPCGSGKKYKHCCNNIVPFPLNGVSSSENSNGSPAQNKLDEFKESVQGQEFSSIDELNAKLSSFFQAQNDRGIDSFLGLSPNQMQEIVYGQFQLNNHIFDLNFDTSLFSDAPLYKQSLFFLKKLQNCEFLKATQEGNLPRSFVIEFYEKFYSNSRFPVPNKETDLFDLTALKHVLDLSGLIKKSKNKYSLTKKGTSLLNKEKSIEIYKTVFLCYLTKFNWGFRDHYAKLSLIQHSAIFGLYLISTKCDEWTLDSEVSQIFLDAFPDLMLECEPKTYSTPEQQVLKTFSLRFLARFCVPWGFLEEKTEGEKYLDRKIYYRKTEFFKKSFSLKI